jgi:hypothetical protein
LLQLLDKSPDRAGVPGIDLDARADRGERPGNRLVCARCGHVITSSGARIEIDGHHSHTFANPHGFVHHLGCFRSAPGVIGVGQPSTEFPWFAGHSWQIHVCGGCFGHLGWLFRAPQRHFFGLLVDQLAEQHNEEGDAP